MGAADNAAWNAAQWSPWERVGAGVAAVGAFFAGYQFGSILDRQIQDPDVGRTFRDMGMLALTVANPATPLAIAGLPGLIENEGKCGSTSR